MNLQHDRSMGARVHVGACLVAQHTYVHPNDSTVPMGYSAPCLACANDHVAWQSGGWYRQYAEVAMWSLGAYRQSPQWLSPPMYIMEHPDRPLPAHATAHNMTQAASKEHSTLLTSSRGGLHSQTTA